MGHDAAGQRGRGARRSNAKNKAGWVGMGQAATGEVSGRDAKWHAGRDGERDKAGTWGETANGKGCDRAGKRARETARGMGQGIGRGMRGETGRGRRMRDETRDRRGVKMGMGRRRGRMIAGFIGTRWGRKC